jgi:hypothetical protein
MKIVRLITDLRIELKELSEKYNSEINTLKDDITKLNKSASNFDGDTWIGQWGSQNFNIYNIKNKSVPLTDEEIGSIIEKENSLNFTEIQNRTREIKDDFENFRIKVITELSILKSQDEFQPEVELLNNIESFNWGMNSWDYVKMRRPKTIMTHNPELILSKGLSNPPHIGVLANLISTFSVLDSILNFEKNVNRLIRQLDIKLSVEDEVPNSSEFLTKVIDSFHNVARQLQNRHSNRETININDEYDVQDLLHAILKINFSDIRAEEYTPSYAGSSTRVDFLLKKEKIVIEVKKTRNGLNDREIGNQLILDTQHYKAHPDCRKLVCFVYDPENRIQNPRGLEEDLNIISSDDFKVEVYIRP